MALLLQQGDLRGRHETYFVLDTHWRFRILAPPGKQLDILFVKSYIPYSPTNIYVGKYPGTNLTLFVEINDNTPWFKKKNKKRGPAIDFKVLPSECE